MFGGTPYIAYYLTNQLLFVASNRKRFMQSSNVINNKLAKLFGDACAFGTIHRNILLTSERGTYVCL